MTGWFEHANLALRQIDLALSARNFTAMHTSAVEAVVSADITARGTLQEVTVAGSVTVPRRACVWSKFRERTESRPALGTHYCWRVRSWSQSPGPWEGTGRGAHLA